MKVHPHDRLLFSWISDPGSEKKEIADHIAGCPRCQERMETGELLLHLDEIDLARHRNAEPPADYGAILDRTLARTLCHKQRLEQEKTQASQLAVRLLSLPSSRRTLLLDNSRRFRTWGLCAWLVEESLREDQPAAAQEDQAQLALGVSRHLDPEVYGAERIEDLRARAWRSIGRSRHLAGDVAGAESAFAAAYRHLLRGTRDGLERACHLESKAPLVAATGRLSSALALLKRAAKLFADAGELHRAGRCLITQQLLKATGEAARRRPGRRRRHLAIS